LRAKHIANAFNPFTFAPDSYRDCVKPFFPSSFVMLSILVPESHISQTLCGYYRLSERNPYQQKIAKHKSFCLFYTPF